jgi:hypothetical protein
MNADDLSNKKIWQQLFYENMFEVLGYSQNKNTFLKLAQMVNMNFLYLFESNPDLNETLESIYFNISGLMPDINKISDENTSDYTRKIFQKWIDNRDKYLGKTLNESDWHFFRIRPQNFPTLRIAGGVRLVNKILTKNLIGNILKKFEEIRDTQTIINSVRNLLIVKSSTYWKNHYTFDDKTKKEIKYLIGSNRADEIILNCVFPFVYTYFELFGKEDVANKVLSAYSELKLILENKIVKETADLLCIEKSYMRTVLYFGLIELYRNYCVSKKCNDCEIGKKIFN